MLLPFITGKKKIKLSYDDKGYRTYELTVRVKADVGAGPLTTTNAVGLPVPGISTWTWGLEADPHAVCQRQFTVTPVQDSEPGNWWDLAYTFSTKPVDMCSDGMFDNPTLIPPKISGSGVKDSKEAKYDKNGVAILNSSHELIRGKEVEFDDSKATIKIQQNVIDLQLPLLVSMYETVNGTTLWGLSPRCIKLSGYDFSQKFYGDCIPYYERTLEFEIQFDTFDRDLLDEGTKVLNGHWNKAGDWVLDNVATLSVPRGIKLTLNSAGGTLPAGVYSYRISASSAGKETLPSSEVSITTGQTGEIFIQWDAIPEDTGDVVYKVYGRRAGLEKLIVGQGFINYFDDGSITPAGDMPTTDTTGVPPDPTNPKHFIRFKDRNSENCRTVLNGHGLPIGINILSNSGITVPTPTVASGPTPPVITTLAPNSAIPGSTDLIVTVTGTGFVVGNSVVDFNGTALATIVINATMIHATIPAANMVTESSNLVTVVNTAGGGSTAGTSASTPFTVSRDSQSTPTGAEPGNIHVEYYQESNFTLLGIPISI